MARIRWYPPGIRYYEVVFKCVGDEMLMRPDRRAVFLIGRAISMACRKYEGIHVHALGFVSNHAHLVLAVEGGARVSSFMQLMNSQIATSLNELRGRRGHFFAGPYTPTPILDDAHLFARMTYVHAQPVHHDLVERAEDWPGLSSFRAVCDGRPCVEVAWLDEEAWRAAGGRPNEIRDYTDTASIPITPLPHWRGSSEDELRRARSAHEQSVRDRAREKLAERAARGEHRRLPRPSSYAKIDPFTRPVAAPERRPRPWAHGDALAIMVYREAYSSMLGAYRVSSQRFRSTGILGVFPEGTYPPRVELSLAGP